MSPENLHSAFEQLAIVNRGEWLWSSPNIIKGPTKTPKFSLEGPRLCTIFSFARAFYTVHELRNKNSSSFDQSLCQWQTTQWCVLYTVKVKKENKNIQHRTFWRHVWSSHLRTKLQQLWNSSLQIIHAWKGFEPMTSANRIESRSGLIFFQA